MKDFIKLVPDVFEYDGPLDLTEYNVKKTQMRIENETVLRVEVGRAGQLTARQV